MFSNDTKLIFMGVRNGTSKAGNAYRVLQVADPARYENFEFFVPDGFAIPDLNTRDEVVVTALLQKRNNNNILMLSGVQKWSEAKQTQKV